MINEGGHEPQNVQVLVQDSEDGVVVCLQDTDSVFLTAKWLEFGATETGPGNVAAGTSGGEGEGASMNKGLQWLREELVEMK